MFSFETCYNQKALTVLAKALRKTIRKKHSRRCHIYGWIVVILGLLLSLSTISSKGFTASAVITWLAILAILVATFAEDLLNGLAARGRMLPGSDKVLSEFAEDGYVTTAAAAKTEWKYDAVTLVAEMPAYFVFVFSKNHAQIYDKSSLTGGTAEDFGRFIAEKTGKDVIKVK